MPIPKLAPVYLRYFVFATRLILGFGLGLSALSRCVHPHMPFSPFKSTQPQNTPPSLPLPHPPRKASSASFVVATRSKRHKLPPNGFLVVADRLNAVFYGLMKPPVSTPIGHIHTASQHLKTSHPVSDDTVAQFYSRLLLGYCFFTRDYWNQEGQTTRIGDRRGTHPASL